MGSTIPFPRKSEDSPQPELFEWHTWNPAAMEPGHIFLLSNRDELKAQDGLQSPWAVLACPHCGTLGLITEQQHLGQDSILCGNPACSCHLYITQRSTFEYLPAN